MLETKKIIWSQKFKFDKNALADYRAVFWLALSFEQSDVEMLSNDARMRRWIGYFDPKSPNLSRIIAKKNRRKKGAKSNWRR